MHKENLPLLFELSHAGKHGAFFPNNDEAVESVLPAHLRRDTACGMPSVSEPEVVRHYTTLSHQNFSVDTDFYPLGSCTMKYNPRINEHMAMLDGVAQVHPLQHEASTQGLLELLYTAQEMFSQLTGMDHFTLQPAAGAHGEFTGLKIILAYHHAHGDMKRTKVIVPDSSHGTNPATAALCGCQTVEIASNEKGLVDLDVLKAVLNDEVACLMLTNPNTLGLFEKDIYAIAECVHEAGGFLYYDGANMNALLDIARPGDMGFDVVHLNLHKTFSTPHGGGGPGSGPVGVKDTLAPFLPVPIIKKAGETYTLVYDKPQSIGKVKAFYGNVGVVVKAYCYMRLLGLDGLKEVSRDAIINANYLRVHLEKIFELPYGGVCMHEFVLSTAPHEDKGIHAVDVGKRLLDYGYHAPTVSFPLIVKDALMIEPTETESKKTLDEFIEAMSLIAAEIEADPGVIKKAPQNMPVTRCDEVKAARTPNLSWQQ